MRNDQRSDVKKTASSLGFKTSAQDSSVQIKGSHRVKHIDTNRTNIDGTTYYGPTDAKKALKSRF